MDHNAREASVRAGYGEDFADCFHLEQPKGYVSRCLTRGPLAVTQINSALPTPEPSKSIAYDEAYLIGVMIDDVPDHDLWQDGLAYRTPAFTAGQTALFDLRRDPVSFTRTGHHSLHFYFPHSTLAELAEGIGRTFDGELHYNFACGYDDPVTRHLALAVLPALQAEPNPNGLFLDHVLTALGYHVIGRFGDARLRRPLARGGLSPAQLRRAREIMDANLGGISIKELAVDCGLSASHFTRAFRQSTGVAPYQWLQRRRVQKAKALLRGRLTTLTEVALECGFVDQSHFSRVFERCVGCSPGRWRRTQVD